MRVIDKHVLAFLASLSPPVSAAQPIVPAGAEPDWIAVRPQIEHYILARLIDPDSAKITWVRGFQWGYYRPPLQAKTWGWKGCGIVNAKNRLGGYTGPKAIIIVWNNGVVFSDSDDNYMFPNISEYCQRNISASVQPALLTTTVPAVASSSVADELAKLAALHERGILSDGEFETQKTKLLAR